MRSSVKRATHGTLKRKRQKLASKSQRLGKAFRKIMPQRGRTRNGIHKKRRSCSVMPPPVKNKRTKKTLVSPENKENVSDQSMVEDWKGTDMSEHDVSRKERKERRRIAGMELPTVIIIDKHCKRTTYVTPRVKIIRAFAPSVPKYCSEARRADRLGSFAYRRQLPGIPQRKFSQHDKQIMERDTERDWPVQAIYDDKSCAEGKLCVYYEGWTCAYLYFEAREKLENATEILNITDIRRNFINARKRSAEKKVDAAFRSGISASDRQAEIAKIFTEPDVMNYPYPLHPFWTFEDLTYFHSVVNKDYGLAPVFYMACVDPKKGIKAPIYAYTAVNIVNSDAYEYLLNHRINRPYEELFDGRSYFWEADDVCMSQSCVCNRRFTLLYRQANRLAQQLKYKKDGRVDFEGFDLNQTRVIVECSDLCGCDSNCTRRRLQKGQTVPLVVNYEDSKGFGLRAAGDIKAGDLVCEYTGHMILLDEHDEDESTIGEKHAAKKRKVRKGSTLSRRVLKKHITEIEDEGNESDRQDVPEKKKFAAEADQRSKDTSYEAGVSCMCDGVAICALTKGNIARFINHSCSANTVFVEVHSRIFESDPLIPRIGVYATEDIPLGEEITVPYWTEEEAALRKKSSVECKCGASNCIKHLPSE